MQRNDPIASHRFKVEIDGLVVAHFQQVSGVGHEVEALGFQEGGNNAHQVKLPGPAKYTKLTLKRGWSGDAGLWRWMKETRDLGSERSAIRRSLDLVVLRYDGSEAGRYTLLRAWPVKWTTEDFQGDSGPAIETLELAHEGLTHTAAGQAPRGVGGPARRNALDQRLANAAAGAAGRPGAAAIAQAARDARDPFAAARAAAGAAAGEAGGRAAALRRAADAARPGALEQAWNDARDRAVPPRAADALGEARRQIDQARALATAARGAREQAEGRARGAAGDAAANAAAGALADAGAPASAQSRAASGARAFARTGDTPERGRPGAPQWSDGVDAEQPSGGFGEPPMAPRGGFA